MWFLLPSDGVFRRSSTSLQYYLTHPGRRVVLRGGDVTRPPMERRLNWILDPAPTPPRNHAKENHPPPAEPRKLPRKMRPRRKRKEHHHHLGASGSVPGTSQSPRCSMSASVKHPQPPQLPQHPKSPAQQPITIQHSLISWTWLNSAGYINRPAPASARTTTRSRQDNFSGSNLSFTCSQRSHRDYFYGSPCRALNKNWHMTDPLREASSVARIAMRESGDPAQNPPCAAMPDVALDAVAEPPEAAATSRIPRADRPPVVLEIPSGHPEPSEPRRCPDIPGKWFRYPARGHKRPRASSPPSPCRPRKRPSTAGRWCE